MRTDGVVLGTLTKCGDRTHVEWVCPDCGNSALEGGDDGPCRFVCERTGREFLVVGLPLPKRERFNMTIV
jgi:hypothetical protein